MSYPQSTAYTAMFKLFLSGTTTNATGKTASVTISKAGGAFGNPSAGASNATELANGWYYYSLSTTDTNTLGDLVIRLTATGCDDAERVMPIVKATNAGLTALPDTAVTTNASLITSGTSTDQLSVSSGNAKGDLAKWLGTAPNALIQGRVDALQELRSATAQSGGASSITLDASASSTSSIYNSSLIWIISGTGAGQVNEITAYDGSTKTATVVHAWDVTPNSTSVFAILPMSYVGIDWGNIVRQTTTQGLSGTTVGTVTTYTGNTPQTGDSYPVVSSGTYGNSAINTAIAAIATKFGGITLLKNWLALIMGKTADTGTLAEVTATTSGATYDNTTDSLQAQQDNGGGGGGSTTVSVIVPPAVARNSQTPDMITIVTTNTASITFESLGSLVGITDIVFTLKSNINDDDADAIAQVSYVSGLLTLNGAAATSGQGAISITDSNAGDITLTIHRDATAEMDTTTDRNHPRYWDIKTIVGTVSTQARVGTAIVTAGITQRNS